MGTYGMDAVPGGVDEPGGGRKASAHERGRDAHIYDEAIRFIEKHTDGPFYVNLWDHIPHSPVRPSQTLLDAFGPLHVDEAKFPPQMRVKFARCEAAGGDVSEHMRAYLAEIRSMDVEIGRLLQRLDELGLRARLAANPNSSTSPPILAKSTTSPQSAPTSCSSCPPGSRHGRRRCRGPTTNPTPETAIHEPSRSR